MDKNELISFCRFFKENTDKPEDPNKQMFYLCEQWWVETNQLPKEQMVDRLSQYMDDYMNAGLSSFNAYDGIPITLKAILFNRYCQYNDRVDIDGFKALYNSEYAKGGN